MENVEQDNNEKNLTIHYEAMRKELDIILTSSIPQQLANMKTLLWVNFITVGLTLQTIKKFPLSDVIIGFFLFSIFSILIIIIAMLTNRTKSYGVPININYMFEFEQDEQSVKNAIYNMMLAVRKDLDDNYKVITNRARLMHIATWFTLSSIFFIFIAFILKQLNL